MSSQVIILWQQSWVYLHPVVENGGVLTFPFHKFCVRQHISFLVRSLVVIRILKIKVKTHSGGEGGQDMTIHMSDRNKIVASLFP